MLEGCVWGRSTFCLGFTRRLRLERGVGVGVRLVYIGFFIFILELLCFRENCFE